MAKSSARRALAGEFTRYVPLNMLGMLALSCYIIADTFFVARGVGADGLTALNLVLPVYSLISGLGLLFGMGGATRYAIMKSAGRAGEARQFFTLALALCAASGALLTLIGGLFAPDICRLLGADAGILPMAEAYLRTIMLFSPAFILNNALVCFVRNDANPRIAMLSMLIGSLSNIVLDYVFVFPMELGMFGAAIATCLAPIIGMLILSLHLFSKKSALRPARLKRAPGRIARVVSVGFSAFVTEFSSGIVMLVFNFIVLSLAGNLGVAAYGVIANVNLFAISIFLGISEGVQPLISRYHGLGDSRCLNTIFRWARGLAFLIGAAVYLAIFFCAEPLALVFNRDGLPGLTDLAVTGMRQYFPALCLSGVNIVTASRFASTARAADSFLISCARSIVLVIGPGLILSRLWGMTGVWWTMPLSEACTCLISVWLMKRAGSKLHSDPAPA